MRKLLILLALPICVSQSVLAVELETKLYGEVNVAYDSRDIGSDDWISYVSRLGLKGSYPLNDDLKVIYQVEQEVDLIHGGAEIDNLLSTRNTFIGVEGNFGKFFFGAHDTAFKKAQGKTDLFSDQSGDIKNLLPGEVRAKDSFFYHSPEFQGFQLQGSYVPADNNFGSSQSASLSWSSDDLYLSMGLDSDMRKNDKKVSSTKVYDAYRLNARYTPGDWTFGVLLQNSERTNVGNAQDETGYLVSASYKTGNVSLMTQYGKSDILAVDAKSLNAGVHYNFNKKTRVYVYYWSFDDGLEQDIVSVGAELKF